MIITTPGFFCQGFFIGLTAEKKRRRSFPEWLCSSRRNSPAPGEEKKTFPFIAQGSEEDTSLFSA
jgi:hypothetical protein